MCSLIVCGDVVTDDGANSAAASTAVTCTKCRQNFASRAALHAHIVDCGDYWRSLSYRLTWVFVLRGSELPAQPSGSSSSSSAAARKQHGRRRGKFRWGSSASHESLRRQMQRMLIKQHVGDSATPSSATAAAAVSGESRRASVRLSSQRGAGGGDSPPLSGGDAATGAVGGPARDPPTRKPVPPRPPPPHALRRHVRRRAAAAADPTADNSPTTGEISTIKCDGCDQTFDSEAERDSHLTGCSRNHANSGTAPGGERSEIIGSCVCEVYKLISQSVLSTPKSSTPYSLY